MSKDNLVSIEISEFIETHIADPSANYSSICGIDGDDPLIDQRIVATTRNKVDCSDCIRIWETVSKIPKEMIDND